MAASDSLFVVLAFVPVVATNDLIASVLQPVVPEKVLGRVSAALGSASPEATPFGALTGGPVASLLGPVPAIALAGVAFLLLACYVASEPSIQRLPAVGEIDTLTVDPQSE